MLVQNSDESSNLSTIEISALQSGDFSANRVSNDVDIEIDDAMADATSIKYINRIPNKIFQHEQPEIVFDDDYGQYDLSKGATLETLNIEIGANQITRYSCGNHKLNLAVRHAIQLHEELTSILFNINKCNSHLRNTIKLNKVGNFF